MTNYKIGILGGGQLGRMLFQASIPFDVQLSFLDKEGSPIQSITPNFTTGSILSLTDVFNFGKLNQVISIEIENVNTEALIQLQKQNIKTIPTANTIQLIKDKGLQKQFYSTNNLPTAPYKLFKTKDALKKEIKNGLISFPFVQKLRVGGYDGKGVQIIKNHQDLEQAFASNFLIEELAQIDKELAIIIARDEKGEIAIYPTVEMLFNNKANLVEFVSVPANINKAINTELKEIATKLVHDLDLNGILAIEFFLNKDGSIWINECAPRTHNSGHWTIEGAHCSQFEQQLRILHGIPLGNTDMKAKSVIMFNLLGSKDHTGTVNYSNIIDGYHNSNTHIHLYGKNTTKPFRKMGHVTMTGNNQQELLPRAC